MLILDRPADTDSQGRDVARPVRLRVRPDGPVVDLPPGKTTVGSSPRCNVRIQQPGVQPLHCLIIHEGQGLSVRRWAGETILNGQRLEESSIGPGDCLRVGPVELEIVQPQAATRAIEPLKADVTATIDSGRIRTARDVARTRSRKLLAALRRDRAAHRELCQRVADLEQQIKNAVADRQFISSELQKVVVELADARQQVMDHKPLVVARQELAARNEQLGREVNDLARRIDHLTHEQAASAAARQSLLDEKAALADEVRRFVDQNAELRDQSGQLTDQHAALCGERDDLRRQNERLQSDLHALAEQKTELADERAVLCGERDGFRRQFEGLQEQLHLLDEEKAVSANELAAVCSERDTLRRQTEQLQSDLHALAEQKTELADERAALCGERDGFHRQFQRLQEQLHVLDEEKAASANELAAVCSERDDLCRQIEQLQSDLQALAGQKTELADEQAVLCGERDGFRRQFERLQEQLHVLDEERAVAANELAAVCGERDTLRRQNEQLQSTVRELDEQTTALARDQAVLGGERDDLRRQTEQLQANVQALAEENAVLAVERPGLMSECYRLRQEADRLGDLERQVREAVADRENTSSELYRALLQLAEMQERDGYNEALAAAHQTLNDELEKSIEEVSQLQVQIDRLSEEHAAADEARLALAQQTSELSEAQQRHADEKAILVSELAEVRHQLEDARRQEAESALRLEAAEAWRQRLEEAERNQTALAEAVARLEGELAGKERTESDAVAVVQDRERQIAEYAQLLAESAESIERLEQQLAAARAVESSFVQERDQWEHNRAEGAHRQAEQSRRIAELEAQLADARAAAKATVQPAANPAPAPWGNEAPVTASQANDNAGHSDEPADFGSDFDEPSAEAPREFDWSSVRGESTAFGAPQQPSDADPFGVTSESGAADESWGRTPGNIEWSGGTERKQDDPVVGEGLPLPGALGDAATDATPEWQSQTPFDSQPPTSFGQPSGKVCSSIVQGDAPDTSRERLASETVESQPASKSFIERYSHMFAEDAVPNDTPPPLAVGREPHADESGSRHPQSMNTVRSSAAPPPATGDDEEESIEQYMAKLLQRVRGDGPATPASQAPPRVLPMTAPVGYNPTSLQATPGNVATPIEPRDSLVSGAVDLESISSFKAKSRNASLPAQQTDLEALRALANESARRAISRHALRKYRRHALTKVIVSTLAGVTSLWLMLESPNWLDLQFITACLSMMVAAYWAGETFRTLLESLRVAARDETDDEIEELSAQLRSPLPIDVETDR